VSDSQPNIGRIVRNQRWRSGVPLGGLGCGKIELLTDGAFGNFTCNHNWDRPTALVRGSFFALHDAGRTTLLRLKRHGEYDRPNLRNVPEVEYNGLFPRATVRFGGLPVEIELEAFSPLIPHNIDDSALPVAFFTFRLRADQKKTVSLLFSWENLLGCGGRKQFAWTDRSGNRHEPISLALGSHDGPVENRSHNWTGLRFTTTPGKPENVTGEYLVLSDGRTTPVEHWDDQAGMIAREVALTPSQTTVVRFMVVWFLPQHIVTFSKRRKHAERVVEVDARAAIDGDPQMKWETQSPTLPGEQLVLDLGASRPLDRILLDNRHIQGDFTAGFTLDSSPDGQTWTPVPHEREAPRAGIAEFRFARRDARYYRVHQTQYGPDWKWTVASVEGRSGDKVVQFLKATGRIHADELVTTRADLGHHYLNRHPDAASLARYAIENLNRLEYETRAWQDLVLRASLPDWLKIKLLNHSYPAFANAILTRDGRFSIAESPVHMDGALGTMDQRMASHGFWLMLFPELDRRELELYAACQDRVEPVADGRIPHFCGNFHNAVGDPMVDYGSTDWPDLSCSWVMQVLKHYRWTGDRGFLDRCWPHVKRAMTWLAAQDTDGDLIPEGGSTYDYEHVPRGAYVFTASVYLGALRAAAEMARVMNDPQPYDDLFLRVQQKTIERLYDRKLGTFIKWRGGDQKIENTFVAALAGDWLMRLTGLEPIFPPDICASTLRETLARHAKSFRPIPPMEVTPNGKVHTQICFVLQHEPYLGCEAIYQGYVDDGLDVIQRVYEAAWELNWSPWDCSLNYESPHGRQSWLLTYMTATATWHVLPALAGLTLDLGAGELHFRPRTAYHGPVFFPTFWGWLDCDEGRATVRVLKVIKPGVLARVNGVAQRLEITPNATWDLSAFAKLPPAPEPVAPRFPDAQPATGASLPRLGLKPWTIHSVLDLEYDVPPIRNVGALDGDPRTCWTTDRPMRPGDWFAVDLGQVRPLAGVRITHSPDPSEYPHGLRVEVSEDEKVWQPVAELSDEQVRQRSHDRVLTVEFTARARWVRLTQLGDAGQSRWSIYEFDVRA